MKRQRSSDDDLGKDSSLNRSSSSSHRSSGFYYKSDAGGLRKGFVSSSSTRFDRDHRDRDRDRDSRVFVDDDDRDCTRGPRKRGSDYGYSDGFDRRKGGFDRYKDVGYGSGERGSSIHRSQSFSGRGGEFPKGFRSERDRSRREGSVSSWRRFKEFDDGGRGGSGSGAGRESRGIGLKEVRSPTRSRDSRDSRSSRDRRSLEKDRDKGKGKEKSSPTWSKDSESERSKSVEVVKRNEDLQVESKGVSNGSEIEEGEFEPELAGEAEPRRDVEQNSEVEPAKGAGSDIRSEHEDKEGESEQRPCDGSMGVEEEPNPVCKEEEKALNEERFSHRSDGVKDDNDLLECDKNSGSVNRMSSSGDETESLDGGQTLRKNDEIGAETGQSNMGDKKPLSDEVQKEDMAIDLEVQVEYGEVAQGNKEVVQGNIAPSVNLESETEKSVQNYKDKGKSVAMACDYVNDTSVGKWSGNESQHELGFLTSEMEGPSTRGFELFSSSPVRKQGKEGESKVDKGKDKKLTLEPLDLSLSLPNVLLPIGARETNQSPDSPSNTRTVHSVTDTFQSDSDAFTASMSFSGSQSFFHNPSCSLTLNSSDNFEESVKSRPIFKGVDWQALSQNEFQKETPFSRMVMMNGNGSTLRLKGSQYQSQASQEKSNGKASQGPHIGSLEGCSKGPNGVERQLSSHKQSRCLDDTRTQAHNVGSREIVSNFSFKKDQKENISTLHRSNSQKEQEKPLTRETDFVEKILARIISDPVHVMARKFHEMTAEFKSFLKESICEMMSNPDNRRQVNNFQMLLQNRSGTTLEMLLKCHHTQLEILVALKTGLPDFLKLDSSISSSDLAEIYLNLKCRNLNCRSLLPVYDCDCKVCAQRDGFCSTCMCLVCSKFDMASNTCSWVGCDFCLHWCHANCGLQANYIRNGQSATGSPGSTEMQFHCVACDHPSEMFGFVKEVFLNFAKEWTVETFRREIEFVKRIFSASKDARGKKLHKIADQMQTKLANESSLPDVFNHVMSFLVDADSSKMGEKPIPSEDDLGKASNGTSGPSHEPPWLQSGYHGKALRLERKTNTRPGSDYNRNDEHHLESELQRSAQKEPIFDELESIVRIKEAEAKMFQARADDARKEAEGLKRIAVTKNEKIEEEYTSRIAKLRLDEAEQMRKKKLEELQALERAHQDYFNMKMRMESDIRDLLSKMEATKRNLA